MRDNMEQRARELAVYIIEQDHHPRRGQALWHFQVYCAYGSNRLGHHRTIVSAAFAQSFAPSVQL